MSAAWGHTAQPLVMCWARRSCALSPPPLQQNTQGLPAARQQCMRVAHQAPTCGVKLVHGALPHHAPLVQENDAVHCRQ
jgi:hypothetical protein